MQYRARYYFYGSDLFRSFSLRAAKARALVFMNHVLLYTYIIIYTYICIHTYARSEQ